MPFMTAQASFSSPDTSRNAASAVEKIKKDLEGFEVAFLLFFTSAEGYEPRRLAKDMRAAFPGAKTFGCSTSGEIHNGMTCDDSVTVMAFSPDVFEVAETVGVSHIDSDPSAARKLLEELGKKLKGDIRSLNYKEYIGFVLVDGLAKSMENALEKLGEGTDIIFTGGCAGDKLKFSQTLVFSDGETYENGMALAILKPRGKWGLIKTQSIDLTPITLTATKVDEENNIVWEFDHEPALAAYAKALGLTEPEINTSVFSNFPLTLTVNGEPFIRSITKTEKEGGLRLYLKPRLNMKYTVGKVKDLIGDTRAAIEAKHRELGSISAIVNVTCVLRKLQILQDQVVESHRDIFAGIASAGFYSFGEIYIGPVNQTATMVALA